MESKYNIDNFERLLRDKTDDFKMYPSKRVWYSIYNSMHPGNRMPSVSMSIVLICSLFLVGYLNTGNPSKETVAQQWKAKTDNTLLAANYSETSFEKDLSKQTAASIRLNTLPPQLNNTTSTAGNSITTTTIQLNNKASRQQYNSSASTAYSQPGKSAGHNTAAIANETNSQGNTDNNLNTAISNQLNHKQSITDKRSILTNNINSSIQSNDALLTANDNAINTAEKSTITQLVEIPTDVTVSSNETIEKSTSVESIVGVTANTNEVAVNAVTFSNDKNDDAAATNSAAENKNTNKNKLTTQSNKAWIENFALYNRPLPKKWAGKLSWQAYVTPSLVYRKLLNNTADKQLSGNGNGNFNNSNVDNVVIQKPSFGVETGLSLQYDLLKIFKVKAGIQLNYTRYNSHAFENHHPIATSLTMNNPANNNAYEVFSTTPYSNSYGLNPVKLHNETYQLSLPIGADVKLFSNDNLAWYAGATIQPTLIIYGKSYLISSDRRNYVQDPTLLNRFNLNAGFETYVSYKTSNYTWQVGPQFRSQIFSTNTQLYSIEERLVNVGVKFGITRRF